MRTAIGIDIGGTKIRAARVDGQGRIQAELRRPTPANPMAVLAAAAALAAELDTGEVAGIGIGIPGRVDAATGAILSGGCVDLSGVAVAAQFTRPVRIGNDAEMALLAEARFGAGRGFRHIVLLTIGTGIGGAVLAEGRVLHGRGTAGQLGHVTVDMQGGTCACGRRGCIETFSSGTALRRLIAAAGLPEGTTADDLLNDRTPKAVALIAAWASPLRLALDSLAAALDPDCIILGGGLGSAATTALGRIPGQSPWFQPELKAAELGDAAGVTGAALAALECLP